MLGAVVGGLLENISMVTGMRSLLLLAAVLYCLAGLGLWLPRQVRFRTSGAARQQAAGAART
jgi:hypothetical protein